MYQKIYTEKPGNATRRRDFSLYSEKMPIASANATLEKRSAALRPAKSAGVGVYKK
jgi:hypothetical protein